MPLSIYLSKQCRSGSYDTLCGIKSLHCLIKYTFRRFQSAEGIQRKKIGFNIQVYYIPITDTTLDLSVFWPSDTESRINELRFSESISLSFKTRLTSVTCFCGDVT